MLEEDKMMFGRKKKRKYRRHRLNKRDKVMIFAICMVMLLIPYVVLMGWYEKEISSEFIAGWIAVWGTGGFITPAYITGKELQCNSESKG